MKNKIRKRNKENKNKDYWTIEVKNSNEIKIKKLISKK